MAGSVLWQAGAEWEVHALSRGPALLEREGLYWYTLADPCDPARLRRLLQDIRPHAIVHTAAIADIDYCEAHRDLADKINVGLTQTLAELCVELGAKLVHCSTDNVFDGEHAPYREEDAPGPVNCYAETKVAAERIVLALPVPAVVARLAAVVGLPVLGAGNSFLSRMRASFEHGREVGVPPAEVRTPVDVITLGQALLELAGDAHTGIFHLAGNDILNRYEMVRRIAARLGFSEGLVVPNDPTGIPGRASRPRDVSLDNAKARNHLKTPMRSLDDGLALILDAERRLVK
ncbi:MAG: SDR family oxidoreductase [Candidatus Hydrogenedentes bacterium]|nr:SDR family oxidoreductase [Candidatus Hydrogenedentota bacterium]